MNVLPVKRYKQHPTDPNPETDSSILRVSLAKFVRRVVSPDVDDDADGPRVVSPDVDRPRVHSHDVYDDADRPRVDSPDVDDDADGPHVERAVVALVLEHFRRQVGRRADDRATERLITDDPREAEITQLYLRMKQQYVK